MEKRLLGKLGETAAVEFLRRKGYKVVKRNWRYGRSEIDIIATHNGIYVACEVKTRRDESIADPVATVDQRQMQRVADSMFHFMDENDVDAEVRFDLIAVIYDDPEYPIIRHYEDAYRP